MTPDLTREARALDTLLTALIEHRDKRAAERWGRPRVGPSPRTGLPVPSQAEAEMIHLLEDPIGAALRQGVRRIGERLLHTLGGTEAMRDVLERVAGMDRMHAGHRMMIVNSAWDGIGYEGDRWCA